MRRNLHLLCSALVNYCVCVLVPCSHFNVSSEFLKFMVYFSVCHPENCSKNSSFSSKQVALGDFQGFTEKKAEQWEKPHDHSAL